MLRKLGWSLLFLCLPLLASPVIASAETVYTVTESDLTQLTLDSMTLREDNRQLQINLETSLKDLESLRTESFNVKLQLSKLKQDSLTAQQYSAETQRLLTETQQSLNALEEAERSKIRTLKIQRDLGYVGILVVALLKH